MLHIQLGFQNAIHVVFPFILFVVQMMVSSWRIYMGLRMKLIYPKCSFCEVEYMLKVMFLMFLALDDVFFARSFQHL